MNIGKRHVVVGIVLLTLIVAYVVGYFSCRSLHVFIHTDCILNLDVHGRVHSIDVAPGASATQEALGHLFWPLREAEAWLHCLRN